MKKLLLLSLLSLTTQALAKTEEAVFAGGNFWRLEADFAKVKGILETVSGFDGGRSTSPTSADVFAGRTDYKHAIRVIYNPAIISYKQLVEFYWKKIDPTDANGQFCDQGNQYRSAIFFLNDKQKTIAMASKNEIEKKFKVIYTEISPSTQFYAADGADQGYYQAHPFRYKYYIYRCGHEKRIQKLWGQR